MPRARDEPVRLTRIYTRGGDAGETSLGDGSRTSKLDPGSRPSAPSTAERHAGVVLAGDLPSEIRPVLERVQNELFDLGADLSVPAHVEGGSAWRRRWSIGWRRTATASTPTCRAQELCPSGRRRGRLAAPCGWTICRRAERRRSGPRVSTSWAAGRRLPQPPFGSPSSSPVPPTRSPGATSLSGSRAPHGTDGRPPGSVTEVFAVALRLGLTSFGGPVAHIGFFRDEYVGRRRWRVLGLVAVTSLLPVRPPASSGSRSVRTGPAGWAV